MSSTPNLTPAEIDARLKRLPDDVQALFASLGALPDQPFSHVGARAVAGVSEARPASIAGLSAAVVGPSSNTPQVSDRAGRELESRLEALVAAGLLVAGADHFRFAPGAHAVAKGLPGMVDGRQRLAHGYMDWLEKHQQDMAALAREQHGWVTAIDAAFDLKLIEPFLYLVGWTAGTGGFYHRRGDLRTRDALLRQAVAMIPGRVDGVAAWILFQYAAVLQEQMKFDEALEQLTRSAYLADAAELEVEAAMARGEMARLMAVKGDLVGAAGLYHQKLKTLQKHQMPREFARTCGDLAEVLVGQGDLDDAAALLEQKLGLLQAMEEEREAAMTRAALGDVKAEQRDFPAAIGHYEAALPVLETLDERNAAVARANLGIYQAQAGDRAGAVASFQRARAVFAAWHLHDELHMVDEHLRALGSGT